MIVFGGEGGAGVDLAPLFRPNVSTNPPSLHGTSSIRGSLHFRGHVAAGSVSLSHSSAAAPALSRVRVQDTFVRSLVWFVRFWCPPVSRISSWTSSRPGTAVGEKDHCEDGRPLITAAVFITLSSSGFPPWTDAWRWTTTRSREPFPLPPPEGKGATKPPPAGEGVKSVHVEQVIV